MKRRYITNITPSHIFKVASEYIAFPQPLGTSVISGPLSGLTSNIPFLLIFDILHCALSLALLNNPQTAHLPLSSPRSNLLGTHPAHSVPLILLRLHSLRLPLLLRHLGPNNSQNDIYTHTAPMNIPIAFP